ncbi:MAG: DUF3179 domain-containing protein, partial [Balneolaceae bacterium]|nr:DUF3179 domain-containing protein [Balneolaceae bacterium]
MKTPQHSFGLLILTSVFLFITAIACNTSTSTNSVGSGEENSNWLLPINEVIDGGPGKDGIPSIENPSFTSIDQADYLRDERLILGIKINNEVRLYPHQIMDWHEIVNDSIDDKHFSITYCPLTGTGIAYNRKINGIVNEFGVSGLLFRNNLIMYDRETDSRWSQMMISSVNGSLSGSLGETFQIVEAPLQTWRTLYPEAKVLSLNTGFSRDYRGFAYGKSYLTDDNSFIFQPKRDDPRLENKTIVHGVMENQFRGESTVLRIYPIRNLKEKNQVINESFRGSDIVFAGSSEEQFGVSFLRTTSDGTLLQFESVQGRLPIIMKDNEGNEWNIFGEAVNGPRKGERLTATRSY